MTGNKNAFSTQTFSIHTHSYISQNTHTSNCLKISIAAPYYIEYAFYKCHQQLAINQLIFTLSIMPVVGLRLMLTPPN